MEQDIDVGNRGFRRILDDARLAPLRSSVPEISSVAWTSFFTGANPGRHGIFGFTDLGPGYRLRFPSLRDVRVPPLWEEWNARGLRTAILNVPATYPAPDRIDGALVSGFVRRSVLIAAVNAGLAPARLLATVAQTGLMVLFIAMALEHLGLGRQVILTSFTILFGGVVLALSLAFGLAGRDLARELLERLMHPPSGDEEGDGLHHL